MSKLTEDQYRAFIDLAHKKLLLNTECNFCKCPDMDMNDKFASSKEKFFFKFKRMTDSLYSSNSTLFTEDGFLESAPRFEDYFIIRICRNCGHREFFDFEVVFRKSYKDMFNEVKSW